jgi:hypothetical protein
MFWLKNNSEASLKYKFNASFIFLPQTYSSEIFKEQIETVLVKSITAPTINIDFERAYANQYVHYFQNGSIHWEPIEIVFYDFISDNKSNVLTNRLFSYLRNINVARENRTQINDLPIFCEQIKINQFINNSDDNTKTYLSIKSPRINKISFGSFDYASDEINTISLTVIPEFCSNSYLDNEVDEAIKQAAAAGELSRSGGAS